MDDRTDALLDTGGGGSLGLPVSVMDGPSVVVVLLMLVVGSSEVEDWWSTAVNVDDDAVVVNDVDEDVNLLLPTIVVWLVDGTPVSDSCEIN